VDQLESSGMLEAVKTDAFPKQASLRSSTGIEKCCQTSREIDELQIDQS